MIKFEKIKNILFFFAPELCLESEELYRNILLDFQSHDFTKLERKQANKKEKYAKVELERQKKQREIKSKIQKTEIQENTKEKQMPAIGSFGAIINIVKNLFRKREGGKFNIKNIKREDYIAAGLTAVIIIALGVILWFIPATRGFIRSLVPF